MVDFVSALQAASAALNVLKELNQVDREFDKAALRLKVAELSGALATVQIALADAQAEARKKDDEIAKLQSNFKQKTEGMIEFEGFMYRKSDDGRPRDRPMCPRCLEDGTVMMMFERGNRARCPECENEYVARIFAFN